MVKHKGRSKQPVPDPKVSKHSRKDSSSTAVAAKAEVGGAPACCNQHLQRTYASDCAVRQAGQESSCYGGSSRSGGLSFESSRRAGQPRPPLLLQCPTPAHPLAPLTFCCPCMRLRQRSRQASGSRCSSPAILLHLRPCSSNSAISVASSSAVHLPFSRSGCTCRSEGGTRLSAGSCRVGTCYGSRTASSGFIREWACRWCGLRCAAAGRQWQAGRPGRCTRWAAKRGRKRPGWRRAAGPQSHLKMIISR